MLTCKLYINRSDPKALHKNIELVKEVNVEMKVSTSVKTPVFELQSFDRLLDCNYLFIPEFNRYYIINSKTLGLGHKWLLDCSCDILMTYAGAIENLTALVERQEHQYSNYYSDNKLPSYSLSNIEQVTIGDVGGDGRYYLTVTNGGIN